MDKNILIVEDDPVVAELMRASLGDYCVSVAATGEAALQQFANRPFDVVLCDLTLPGMGGLQVIQEIRSRQPQARIMVVSAYGTAENLLATLREQVVDFLVKPFTPHDLQCAVANLLACEQAIEVVSATPQWIELRMPASFQVAASLDNFFANLHVDIDEGTRRSVGLAFRELLNNAIEHGCKGDPERKVGICYMRLQRAIIYRIQDPGPGFEPAAVYHAAIANPPEDPLRHLEYRQQKGLRSGGYGLLWIRTLADELIYSERRNEVVFVKYLDPPPATTA